MFHFGADGYKTVRPTAGLMPVEGQRLGVHGTQRYPEHMAWFEPCAAVFLRRFLADPLMGVLAAPLTSATGAKDFRTYGGTRDSRFCANGLIRCRRMHPAERGNGSGLPAAGEVEQPDLVVTVANILEGAASSVTGGGLDKIDRVLSRLV